MQNLLPGCGAPDCAQPDLRRPHDLPGRSGRDLARSFVQALAPRYGMRSWARSPAQGRWARTRDAVLHDALGRTTRPLAQAPTRKAATLAYRPSFPKQTANLFLPARWRLLYPEIARYHPDPGPYVSFLINTGTTEIYRVVPGAFTMKTRRPAPVRGSHQMVPDVETVPRPDLGAGCLCIRELPRVS